MWNLKYDTNELTKQKQIHRHREHTGGYQVVGSLGLAEANYCI